MNLTTKARMQMAAKGQAMKDGSFPVNSVQMLMDAIHLVGNAKDPKAAKAHIIAQAKALGATSKLPASWVASPGRKPTPAAGSPAKGTVPAGLAAYQASKKAGTLAPKAAPSPTKDSAGDTMMPGAMMDSAGDTMKPGSMMDSAGDTMMPSAPAKAAPGAAPAAKKGGLPPGLAAYQFKKRKRVGH